MLKRSYISKLIALFVGLSCLVIAYNHNSSNKFIYKGTAYGTTWSVTTTKYLNDSHKLTIKDIIRKIDYVASNYKEDSEIAKINSLPDSLNIGVSKDLYQILDIANEISNLTNNAYDIKLGKYSSSLGFSPTFNKDLSTDGKAFFSLNKTNQTLYKKGNFWFDLSSIAKGYAIDKIVRYLEINNFRNFIVEIGGELTVKGFNNESSWLLAIQDPRLLIQEPGKLIANTAGEKISIATSGEYRNYIYDKTGNKITHTLNPVTKKSIVNDSLSVTVISKKTAAHADALATAFNVMSIDNALELANSFEIAAMFIIQDADKLEFIYTDAWYYSANE